MARLKIGELAVESVEQVTQDKKQMEMNLEKLAEDLKPLMLTPINNSLQNLANDITKINQNEKMSLKLDESLKAVRSEMNVSNQELEDRLDGLQSDMAELKVKQDKPVKIEQPSVQNITTVKDVSEKVKLELEEKIKLTAVDNRDKIEKVMHKLCDQVDLQKKINIGLAVGMIISILLHLL